MEKNWIRYMGLQAQESARRVRKGDQEGKMRRDRPNQVGNTARQSLPASRGEGTQRVPNKVTTKYLLLTASQKDWNKKSSKKNISSKNVPGKLKKRGEPWVESSPVRSRRLRQGTSRRVPCQEGWCHHHYDCHHQQDPC